VSVKLNSRNYNIFASTKGCCIDTINTFFINTIFVRFSFSLEVSRVSASLRHTRAGILQNYLKVETVPAWTWPSDGFQIVSGTLRTFISSGQPTCFTAREGEWETRFEWLSVGELETRLIALSWLL